MASDPFSLDGKTIYVAGHKGMVGSALVRRLAGEGCELLTRERAELDLTDGPRVRAFMTTHRPDAVVLAAAKVGGILANASAPATFLAQNLAIQQAVINAAFEAGVRRLVFVSSSAVYPRNAPQPMAEDALLTGPLEPTHEGYAIAKIAGMKLCSALRTQHGADYFAVTPTNLYGPKDNFDPQSSHVVAGMLRRAHEAKLSGSASLTIWGSGSPRREFLHVDDCADAIVHLLKAYSGEGHVNIGTGEDLTIGDLAERVAACVGFSGEIVTDPSKPDGPPRKLLNVDRLRATGWRPKIALTDGLSATYEWFLRAAASGGSGTGQHAVA